MDLSFFRGHNGVVHGLSVCKQNLYFCSSSDDMTLKLWSPEYCHPLRTFAGHSKVPTCLRFHHNGLYLASGSLDNTVRLWSVVDGRTVRLLSGHEEPVRAVAFHPDGRTLASVGEDSQVCKICIHIVDVQLIYVSKQLTFYRIWAVAKTFF